MPLFKSLFRTKPRVTPDSCAEKPSAPPKSSSFPRSSISDFKDTDDKDPRVSVALQELTSSVNRFEQHYEYFAKRNRLHLVQLEVDAALSKAKEERDFRRSALVFGNEITSVLEATAKKQKLTHSKWTHKLGAFLITLYPIVKLSLGLAGAAAEVCANRLD